MGEARRRARDYTQSMPGRDDRLRSMSRASDFMPTRPIQPQAKAEDLLHGSEEKQRIRKQKRSVWRQIRRPLIRNGLLVCLCLIALAGGGLYWWQKQQATKPQNPFSPAILASIKVPLYYPTKIPAGYHIDAHSVTIPSAGVVVFNIVGPNGEKLYVSEEERPATFDIGRFYNQFSHLKVTPVSDGSIAVGYLNNGQTEVASRATGNTWLVSNTHAHIPPSQLTAMLQSLTVSY